MEYPHKVKIKSPAIAKKAKSIAEEMSEIRTELDERIERLEGLRKKLWTVLDKDENIDASDMSYNYNGEDHTVTCEGEMKGPDSIVEGLMKMIGGGGTPPSTTKH